MTEQPIRVGIVGAGDNTRKKHIPGLQAIPGVEIVSLCNRSLESSRRVADEFGIPTVYEHWWELVDAGDTDAIVIGTWPYMHCTTTVRALEAGKHVMCEARMARNLDEAQAMLAASQAHPQRVTQIVPSPMTLGVDRTIKRLLAANYLGDVLAIEIRAGNSFVDPEAAMHWRNDYDLSGLNIMAMGIWYEALLRWVGEATAVMAMGKIFTRMRPDASGSLRPVRIPEHLDVVADMACGAQARLSISSVTGLAGADMATLYGSGGTLRFTGGQLYGAQRGDDALQPIAIPPEERGGWRVEEEFIRAIRGQEAITHTNFETGVKYMAFTEAVSRSMAERRTIPIY
ncbi:MAG: Gfo/Idh/MocA family oxidoreductase [Anaerolineae bacterium]|nr:Gfo/Idh/MocA family oxidoreductase [Anaerolineae bacterium]